MQCAVCCERADPSLSIRHRQCGHHSHARCLREPVNYKLCGVCSGEIPERPAAAVAAGLFEGEPHTTDGIDYVLHPGQKQNRYSVLNLAASILSRKKEDSLATTQDFGRLLDNKVKLQVIMERNKLGLDHALQQGITAHDFLKNGYTWNDLLQFEDISKKGSKRALQALTTGLKANANLFRDYPDAFPFDKIKEHTKFESKDLCLLFGLYFPENGPLECENDQKWNAQDCVNLGLKIDDLQDFGLCLEQQYIDLMGTLNSKEADKAEAELGTTLEHLKGLKKLNASPVPKKVVVKQKAPEPEVFIEEESFVHVASPPPPVPEEDVVIVEEEEEEESNLVFTENKERAGRPSAKLYQLRQQQRLARHGKKK
jgi:hypothetical protein